MTGRPETNGSAPVTGEHARHELDILDVERLIEPEACAKGFDRGLAGLIAENDLCRVSGQDADDEKDDGEHAEQRDHGKAQSFEDEASHAASQVSDAVRPDA